MTTEKTIKEKVLEEYKSIDGSKPPVWTIKDFYNKIKDWSLNQWKEWQETKASKRRIWFHDDVERLIELTEKLTRKDLICPTCGFPKNMERAPAILDSNPLSFAVFFENTCEECGHQKDGSTIKVVLQFWQKLANELIRRKEEEHQNILNTLEKEIEDIESNHKMIPANPIGQYAEAYKEGCLDTIKKLKDLLQKINGDKK